MEVLIVVTADNLNGFEDKAEVIQVRLALSQNSGAMQKINFTELLRAESCTTGEERQSLDCENILESLSKVARDLAATNGKLGFCQLPAYRF